MSRCTMILACLTATLNVVAAHADERPNILFIMSDDHCARTVGAYGLRLAELNPTPNLDALARRGMLFDNVFCTKNRYACL